MYFYTNPFNRFNSLLDEVMGHPLRELDKISIFDKSSAYSPVETEDSHTIEISVPGFSKKDINNRPQRDFFEEKIYFNKKRYN